MFKEQIDIQWRIMAGQEKECYVRDAEEPIAKSRRGSPPWRCLLCSTSCVTKKEMLDHIRMQSVTSPVFQQYFTELSGTQGIRMRGRMSKRVTQTPWR